MSLLLSDPYKRQAKRGKCLYIIKKCNHMSGKIGEDTVFYIGKYLLPYPVKIIYEEESVNYICAICHELRIGNCAVGIVNAKYGLEAELTKAIETYVDNSEPEELAPEMQTYRALLGDIQKINRHNLM